MMDYEKKLKKILSENGCLYVRDGNAEYEIWFSSLTKRYFSLDMKIKSKRHANTVLRHSGVSHQI